MLRWYIAWHCFGLSEGRVEDALHVSHALRRFVSIERSRDAAPDAATLQKFRRLIETHDLAGLSFETIRDHRARAGLVLHGGAMADATLIGAPPSTKSRDRARDRRMHPARKGTLTLPRFDVHQNVDNFLMNGGRDGQENVGTEPAVPG